MTIPEHPGIILKREIDSRGMQQKQFAAATGIGYWLVMKMCQGHKSISLRSSFIIGAFFDIDPAYFSHLQWVYNLAKANKDKQFAKEVDKVKKWKQKHAAHHY